MSEIMAWPEELLESDLSKLANVLIVGKRVCTSEGFAHKPLVPAPLLSAPERAIDAITELSASLNRASDACASVQRERDALREMLGEFEQQLLDVGASLAAAISLLERAPATIAPSKKMFDQMKADYRASLERARAFLSRYEGEVK